MKDISSIVIPEIKKCSLKDSQFNVYTGLIQNMKSKFCSNSSCQFALLGGSGFVAYHVCYNALKLHNHPQLLKKLTSKGFTVVGLVVYNVERHDDRRDELLAHMVSLEEQLQTPCLMIWFNGNINPQCFELHSGELVEVTLGKASRKKKSQEYLCYNVEDLNESIDGTIAKRIMEQFKKIACKSKAPSKPTAFFKHGPTPPDG